MIRMRSGQPATPASAKRLLLPPISARGAPLIRATPQETTIFLANGLPRAQDKLCPGIICCACSVRARQAEHVLGEVGQDQVGRDRRGLVEPGLAKLALDVELLGEA